MVQVDSAWNAGDYHGAHRNSTIARNLSITSIFIGTIIFDIIIILFIYNVIDEH